MEGIITNIPDELADFVINTAYPSNVYPVSCVLSGSRAYGLNLEDSDYDFIGIHLMDTWNCLQHPDFREKNQVVRRQFNKELEEEHVGTPKSFLSLDSFELWKLIDLVRKGSPVAYEVLYLPEIHHDNSSGNILSLMRGLLTSQIGRAAKGNAYHHWRKQKTNRKKSIMAYYRLLQAIHFLRESGQFEWSAEALWGYGGELVSHGKDLLKTYMDPDKRCNPIGYCSEEKELVEKISGEIDRLTEEVDRAMIVTKLPDRYPKDLMLEILDTIQKSRARLI